MSTILAQSSLNHLYLLRQLAAIPCGLGPIVLCRWISAGLLLSSIKYLVDHVGLEPTTDRL